MNAFVNISQELHTAAWVLSPLFMEICIYVYEILEKYFLGTPLGLLFVFEKRNGSFWYFIQIEF